MQAYLGLALTETRTVAQDPFMYNEDAERETRSGSMYSGCSEEAIMIELNAAM